MLGHTTHPALDDAVGVRGAVPCAHVGQVRPRREPARRRDRLHGRAVVGHDRQRDDLAGAGVGAVLGEATAQQRLDGIDRGVQGSVQGSEQVSGGLGDRDGARQGDLGGVVDAAAELLGALGRGLKGREVHLPDAVAAHGRLHEHLPAGRCEPPRSAR